jgi:hypothetical protein
MTSGAGQSAATISVPEFESLHQECLSALAIFTIQARETCRLLAMIETQPVRPELQTQIEIQRAKESEAYKDYANSRAEILQRFGVRP